MQSRNPKGVPSELVQLVEKQIESLEKETFGGVTDAERREYENRQDRIDELRQATLPAPRRIGNGLAW
jgi:hypothetical protein